MSEKPFDIVIDTLQERLNALVTLTNQNMELGLFGVMDQIRLEQVEQLVRAMEMWETK